MPPMKPVIPKDVKSVTDLPLRLRNFLARYPPEIHSSAVRRPDFSKLTEQLSKENASGEIPSPYTPDRDAKGSAGLDKNAWTPSKALLITSQTLRNPFIPFKGRAGWESPKYGLRQQADLMKLAAKYGIQGLLPPSMKSTEYKETRRAERGLAIKGTGVGQKVKGHKWERTMESRLEERRKAMEGMPELVRLWKQRGHGRGWKSWPKR
ncbi:uncharacterized protein N7511_010434 [Penicillium nucicola]|uniref:uncharacterized protein n=1 Tax=Penicillium nucicola TaxID=1850975 RepID=UPI002545002D|nr:uncharacterized protein N7511_010434 [Penicillium nucicola]KAJ5748738.1 hypothetical protein N7511_010434 [Penicillium nucicola]